MMMWVRLVDRASEAVIANTSLQSVSEGDLVAVHGKDHPSCEWDEWRIFEVYKVIHACDLRTEEEGRVHVILIVSRYEPTVPGADPEEVLARKLLGP